MSTPLVSLRHEFGRERALPNALTAANLACGVGALAAVGVGAPASVPFAFVAAALVFDLLDGRAARALHSANGFGAQLDSLADLVSFGVAPAALAWTTLFTAPGTGLVAAATAVTWVLAAAFRLARFNVAAAAGESSPVIDGVARIGGLPVTLPAAIGVGVAAGAPTLPPLVAILGACALAALMVSRLPYRSFKDRGLTAVAVAAVAAVAVGIALTGDVVRGLGAACALGGTLYAASAPLAVIVRGGRAR